jgi:hypothetical protein
LQLSLCEAGPDVLCSGNKVFGLQWACEPYYKIRCSHSADLPLQQAAEAGPGLSEVLTPEVTVPLVLSDDAALERLAPFLPEQHRWVSRSLLIFAMVILAMLLPEV